MSLRAAILGFLELEPMSGYTLQQRFDGSIGGFWTATQSQIYRELHALERDGLVTVRVEHGDGKPSRKIYANTKAGRAALVAWLREPLDPLQLRHPLLLKLVFAAELDPEALDGVLAGYEQGLAATRSEYAARMGAEQIFTLARSPREALLWELTLDHGVAWVDTELAWVRKARKRLGTSARTKTKTARTRRKPRSGA